MLLRVVRSAARDLVAALPFLTAALMAAGVVHIVAALALAELGTARPFARLKPVLAANTATLLEPVSPGRQPLPFMMPHMAYAVCRFDVRAGPVLVKTTLEADGWSLSLHGPGGENFHLVPGTAQRLTPVELIIVPPGNRFYAHTPELLFMNEQVPEVKPAEPEGLVVLRAPFRGVADRIDVERRLAQLVCRPVAGEKRAPLAAAGAPPRRR